MSREPSQCTALEAVHNDAEALAGYMKANSAIAAFLKNPVIDDKKKKDIVTKIVREARLQPECTRTRPPAPLARHVSEGSRLFLVQGSFSPIFANFLNLLVDKRRMQLVGNIVEEFEVIYCNLTDTQVSVVNANVTFRSGFIWLLGLEMASTAAVRVSEVGQAGRAIQPATENERGRSRAERTSPAARCRESDESAEQRSGLVLLSGVREVKLPGMHIGSVG